MQNIEKLDDELGKSAIIDRWDNNKEIKEPDQQLFYDPVPITDVKDKQPEAQPLPRYDLTDFKIEASADKFDPGLSSKLDSDADKTFPYHEVDKLGGGTIIANDDKNTTIEHFNDSVQSRPQSLALDGGTPFGGPINNTSQTEQLDYNKIQQEAQKIKEKLEKDNQLKPNKFEESKTGDNNKKNFNEFMIKEHEDRAQILGGGHKVLNSPSLPLDDSDGFEHINRNEAENVKM